MGYKNDNKGKLDAESRVMLKIDNMKDTSHIDERMEAFKPVKNITRSPYSLFNEEYEGSKRRKTKRITGEKLKENGGTIFSLVGLVVAICFVGFVVWYLYLGGAA